MQGSWHPARGEGSEVLSEIVQDCSLLRFNLEELRHIAEFSIASLEQFAHP
jgi:hypothetical protein